MFTNLPQDVITNTFHFSELTVVGLEPAADALTPKLADFYEAVYNGSLGMASYMQPTLAQVHWYDLNQPEPRIPYTLPLGASIPVSASSLPTEVAAVLSFQGDPAPGVPQARRRGRIYLGAVNHNALASSSVSAFPIWSTAWVAGIVNGANTHLLNAGVTGMRWSVWSTVDQAPTYVTNGWCDNSPDTQRRRSVDPTVRTVFPVT